MTGALAAPATLYVREKTTAENSCLHKNSGYAHVLLLLTCCVNVSSARRTRQGESPLWLAAARGLTEMVGILLEAGADPDAK